MSSAIQSAIETLQDAIKRAIDQVRSTTDMVDQAHEEYMKLVDQRGRELDRLIELERALDVLEELDLEEDDE